MFYSYSVNKKTVCKKRVSAPAPLPVHLSLLVDDAMGFFSGYPAMEPQLSHVDDCREKEIDTLFILFKLKPLKKKKC